MLYLIATPIGNLSDITLRALDVLKSCDYILCEDTRHSSILLNHYEIKKPLISYHKFNESYRCESVLEDLLLGKTIGLISDAGMPGICDPGSDLVKNCIQEKIPYTVIPGSCALIVAAVLSGFSLEKFQFIGFLPKKESELKKELQLIFSYRGTTICYESPHRLISVLELIDSIEPKRELVLAKELTKKFEQVIRGCARDLLSFFGEDLPRGEMVLLIAPSVQDHSLDWSHMTPAEHVAWMQATYHIDKKEAIRAVATLRGLPKRDVYTQTI